MATQSGILNFTGKLGNMIGYRRNGTYFTRSMPASVKQTTATQRASRDFGIASRKGKLIRRAIVPHLHLPHDGSLVNRLNKTLIQSGTNLKGFRFNRHAAITQFFTVPPVVSQSGTCNIPAQTLLPPPTATHLEITAMAVRINFAERRITGNSTTAITIDLNKPFDGAILETNTPGKGTLLILLQVKSFNGTSSLEDRRFTAADIIVVITTKQKTNKRNSIPSVKRTLPLYTVSPIKRPVIKQQRE